MLPVPYQALFESKQRTLCYQLRLAINQLIQPVFRIRTNPYKTVHLDPDSDLGALIPQQKVTELSTTTNSLLKICRPGTLSKLQK